VIAPERFWARVEKLSTGCWEWSGFRNLARGGYGYVEGRRAHRVAWELANGPIPEGLHVCHRCDNPPCCNPSHLWLGTDLDNARDKIAKRRQDHSGLTLGPAARRLPYPRLTLMPDPMIELSVAASVAANDNGGQAAENSVQVSEIAAGADERI
jgi:hypothetical protein